MNTTALPPLAPRLCSELPRGPPAHSFPRNLHPRKQTDPVAAVAGFNTVNGQQLTTNQPATKGKIYTILISDDGGKSFVPAPAASFPASFVKTSFTMTSASTYLVQARGAPPSLRLRVPSAQPPVRRTTSSRVGFGSHTCLSLSPAFFHRFTGRVDVRHLVAEQPPGVDLRVRVHPVHERRGEHVAGRDPAGRRPAGHPAGADAREPRLV